MTRNVLVFVCVAAVLVVGCKPKPSVDPETIAAAQAAWELGGTRDYDIVAEVKRVGDRRRSTLRVRGGIVESAQVSFYDEGSWSPSIELNPEQAHPFTVPGLFQTISEELAAGQRSGVWVKMDGEPPFPHTVVLGDVVDESGLRPNTETVIRVLEFEPVRE